MIRQLYECHEGSHLPVPWCEDFSFPLDDIFTRLKFVRKGKFQEKLCDEVINMTDIFETHKDCQSPRIVLIEGDPGIGKTTYCQKLAYDWATKQEKDLNKFEVALLLRCRDIKSDIKEAIYDQLLPGDADKEAKEQFFTFIHENSSRVLLIIDGLDELDPSKLETINASLFKSKLLPHCHTVVTSRPEIGKKVRRYCDTLWEIVGF